MVPDSYLRSKWWESWSVKEKMLWFLVNTLKNHEQFIKLLQLIIGANVRSSHQRCSIKSFVLTNFAIFTGKYRCWSLFSIKLQAWTPILKNICERLLLKYSDQNVSHTLMNFDFFSNLLIKPFSFVILNGLS